MAPQNAETDIEEKREEVDQTVQEQIRERFGDKEPDEDEKTALKREHLHHEVRYTTSQLSVDAARDLEGVEVDAEIEVPDMYCFTCDEWVGLSGIGLRGTPRSKDVPQLGDARVSAQARGTAPRWRNGSERVQIPTGPLAGGLPP